MEIVKSSAHTLTNYQVYDFLKEKKAEFDSGAKGNRKGSHSSRAATITLETLSYLDGTPAKHQSEDIIKELAEKLSKFNLSHSEELLLLNHRPTQAVEIQLMIEDSEERLSEDQVEEIIGILQEVLPTDPEEEGEGEEGQEEGEQQQEEGTAQENQD